MAAAFFRARLLRLALAVLAAAAALRLAAGATTFRIYGPPVLVLLALPFLHRTLADRLGEFDRSRRESLLVTVPLGAAAALDLVYWLAFLRGSANLAIQLGVARHFVQQATGRYLPWLAAGALLLLARFLYSLGKVLWGRLTDGAASGWNPVTFAARPVEEMPVIEIDEGELPMKMRLAAGFAAFAVLGLSATLATGAAHAAKAAGKCETKRGKGWGFTEGQAKFQAWEIIGQTTGNWPIVTDTYRNERYKCSPDGNGVTCYSWIDVCKS